MLRVVPYTSAAGCETAHRIRRDVQSIKEIVRRDEQGRISHTSSSVVRFAQSSYDNLDAMLHDHFGAQLKGCYIADS